MSRLFVYEPFVAGHAYAPHIRRRDADAAASDEYDEPRRCADADDAAAMPRRAAERRQPPPPLSADDELCLFEPLSAAAKEADDAESYG